MGGSKGDKGVGIPCPIVIKDKRKCLGYMIFGAKKHEYRIMKLQEAENKKHDEEWRKSNGAHTGGRQADGPKGKAKGVKGKFDKPKGKGCFVDWGPMNFEV